jgi:hypothetical protein
MRGLTLSFSILIVLLLGGCYEYEQSYYYPQQQFYVPAPCPTVATQPPPVSPSFGALGVNKYHPDSLANPYGAGSPYKPDGLMNPYSQYGSRYSNKSWRNPYATDAPKLYDSEGNYRGKLSTNRYDPDSISNPYGRYGSRFSPDSINNPFGAGNPYLNKPIYVVPSTK